MTASAFVSRHAVARRSIIAVCLLFAAWSVIAFVGAWFTPKPTDWSFTHQLLWTLCADLVIALLFILFVAIIRFCIRQGKRNTP